MNKLFLTIILSAFMISCVTPIVFTTNEPGANVYLDGKHIGTTPLTTEVESWSWYDPDVKITKEGFKDYEGKLKIKARKDLIISGAVFAFFTPIGVPLLLNCWGPVELQAFELEATQK